MANFTVVKKNGSKEKVEADMVQWTGGGAGFRNYGDIHRHYRKEVYGRDLDHVEDNNGNRIACGPARGE